MDSSATPSLAGNRVLVVEDEFFLASDLEQCLRAAGADVIGPTGSYEAAERLIEHSEPSCVILDMNLRGVPGGGLADLLDRKGIKYLVLSGYDPGAFPGGPRNAPCLAKPALPGQIVRAIADLVAEKAA